MRMAKVQFGGVVREACLEYVPETQVGQYVLVHVGFAISRSMKRKLNALTNCWKKWINLPN